MRAGYILAFDEWELDLHNDYDLAKTIHKPSEATASITFRRTNADWVNEFQPESVALLFEQVSRFLTSEGNAALVADQKTVAYIGFLFPEDEAMTGYLEDQSDPSQDLIIGMEDESAVRVQAEFVALSVDA